MKALKASPLVVEVQALVTTAIPLCTCHPVTHTTHGAQLNTIRKYAMVSDIFYIYHDLISCLPDFYTHACGSWSLKKAISPSILSTSYADSPPNQYTVLQSKVDYNLWSMLTANQTDQSFDVQLFEKCFHRGKVFNFFLIF